MTDSPNENNSSSQETEKQSGMSMTRALMIAAGVVLVVLIPLIVGVLVAVVADPGPTAERFAMIRDLVIIALAMQGILIIVALTTLILQVARLVSLLQSEVRPIIDDGKAAAQAAKGSAQFVGKNVTQPLISTRSFLAGSTVFLREFTGIGRVVRPMRRNGSRND